MAGSPVDNPQQHMVTCGISEAAEPQQAVLKSSQYAIFFYQGLSLHSSKIAAVSYEKQI